MNAQNIVNRYEEIIDDLQQEKNICGVLEGEINENKEVINNVVEHILNNIDPKFIYQILQMIGIDYNKIDLLK